MSIKLRELIKSIRGCKTAQEERTIIAKECAAIRTSFKEEENQYRHRNIAKLLFIHMLGYPTHFGQMECLKLIVSPSYSDKRIGYLGLMLLLDERQEVLMLVTNSLQNDLNHPNQYVVGLALCSLANISSSSIARDLSPNVVKLLGSSNPYIRKKAALCAIRTIRKVPDLIEQFVPKVHPLLNERNHHGVLITAVSLMIEISELDPKSARRFRKLVPVLVRTLKNLVLSGYAPEHDVNGVTDPFLQVKILKMLRILGKNDPQASDVMNDILAQVATNTESTRNVGNAILYECVQTIMSIESESGLRVLAINILGRFLLNKDNNIRYVGLNTLHRVVSVDHQAVQRHRSTIVDCLRDPDISIRRRALDLVYALVNETNIKALMKEMLNFLLSADYEQRVDLTVKICWAIQKYSPSPKWHLDTILRVMAISGEYIPEEVVASTVQLVLQVPEIQQYAVQKLYTVLSKEILRQPLVQTGVWMLGEFADVLVNNSDGTVRPTDILELFDNVMKHPSSTEQTKEYVLTAIIKLSDRLAELQVQDDVETRLNKYKTSLSIELQQRACEYHSLLTNVPADKRGILLEKVPALDLEEEDDEGQAQEAPQQQQQQQVEQKQVEQQQSQAQPEQTAPPQSQNLLDLLSGPTTPVQQQPTTTTPAGGNLLDLLGGPAPVPTQPVVNANPLLSTNPTPVATTPPVTGGSGIPPLEVYNKAGIRIVFNFLKKPTDPQLTLINITYYNSTNVTLQNFIFQAAVPTYMTVQMNPPSGTVLAANGTITQQAMIANPMIGQKPAAMRVKLDFVANGNPISDLITIANFPNNV